MNSTLLAIQTIILLIHSLILAYAGRMQATTLYLGKKLAHPSTQKELPRGLQDAITPKIQDTLNTINIFGWIILIILGTYIAWYIGIISLLAAVILQSLFQIFMPKNLEHYYLIIQYYMMNKIADYNRDKDTMRTEAAGEVLSNLVEIYENEIKGANTPVPSIIDVKRMPFGSIEKVI